MKVDNPMKFPDTVAPILPATLPALVKAMEDTGANVRISRVIYQDKNGKQTVAWERNPKTTEKPS